MITIILFFFWLVSCKNNPLDYDMFINAFVRKLLKSSKRFCLKPFSYKADIYEQKLFPFCIVKILLDRIQAIFTNKSFYLTSTWNIAQWNLANHYTKELVLELFLTGFAWELKPMDSFGTWRKWKWIFFVVVDAEFYRVLWTINALLTVCFKMLPFSGNNQNIKMFGVPPEHFAIPYVHNDNLPLRNIALQYVIQNNCMNVWWCFLMISCTFWRSRKSLWNSPKLSCGFKLGVLFCMKTAFYPFLSSFGSSLQPQWSAAGHSHTGLPDHLLGCPDGHPDRVNRGQAGPGQWTEERWPGHGKDVFSSKVRERVGWSKA